MTYKLRFRCVLRVDDNIKSARFKNQQQWLAYLKKLRLFAAARRTPPSPLEPVSSTICFNKGTGYTL